jgi:hypothetical protein
VSPSEMLTSAPTNWSNLLAQIRRDYETPPAMGVAHGLQKDAIQNGWGARVSEKGNGFAFNFSLIKGGDGNSYLTMTDSGTTGLIGNVFDYRKDLPPNFPPEEKLARFECMFDSGGGVGPGLFGRGKLLFNAASKNQEIYYDSLTVNGQYRLGKRHIQGRQCNQLKQVYEGAQAKEQLKEWSQGTLKPLETPGTRITVVNPIPEVASAIADGTFIKAIEETWWEIIQKYDAVLTVSDLNGTIVRARIPAEFAELPKKNANGWRVYYRQNVPVQAGDTAFRIKHLHLLLPPSGHSLPPDLRGVSLHRRGMKISSLQLSGIPDEIEDRFFGYVQVIPELEELLAKAESTTHYGFASRHNAAYRNLKQTVQGDLDLFMQELGYRKAAGDPDEKAKRLMEEASEDLDSILSGMGVPSFGSGKGPEPGVSVAVKDLRFPNDTNYLKGGDEIQGFWYQLTNTTGEPLTVRVQVWTHERDTGLLESLLDMQDVRIKKTFDTDQLCISISKDVYPLGKKIGCTIRVTDSAGKELASKTFFLFVELQPPVVKEFAQIRLLSATWPRPSSRRVDFDQSIQNLVYEVENLTGTRMNCRLKLRTLWVAEHEPIDTAMEQDLELNAFETKSIAAGQVLVSKDKYFAIQRGKMILRCHAVGLDKTPLWEKGTRLAEHNLTFWLNMDPKYGFFEEDHEFFEGGARMQRSEAVPVEGLSRWKLRINSTHPAYLDVQGDDPRLKNYLFEEMAKQTIFVLLRKDQVEAIRRLTDFGTAQDIEDMSPDSLLQQIAYKASDRIIAEYYRG